MRRSAVVPLLVLALAGCGSQSVRTLPPRTTTVSPSPSLVLVKPGAPAPSASPSVPAPVTVTAGVREVTARLTVGQVLVVQPTPGRRSGGNAFVAETGSAVLKRDGGNAATGWRFLALGRGSAHVVVSYGPQCVPGELCPMFRGLLARVAVTVS